MAIKLREGKHYQYLPKRGPELLRKKFVPELGQFIYAWDTRKVFIGDGVTSGGLLIGIMPKEITIFDEKKTKE